MFDISRSFRNFDNHSTNLFLPQIFKYNVALLHNSKRTRIENSMKSRTNCVVKCQFNDKSYSSSYCSRMHFEESSHPCSAASAFIFQVSPCSVSNVIKNCVALIYAFSPSQRKIFIVSNLFVAAISFALSPSLCANDDSLMRMHNPKRHFK